MAATDGGDALAVSCADGVLVAGGATGLGVASDSAAGDGRMVESGRLRKLVRIQASVRLT